MDSLLVDLDKVLDDFEAEENLAPDNELKPCGLQCLEPLNNQTWNVFDNSLASELCHSHSNDIDEDKAYISEKGQPAVRYGPDITDKGLSNVADLSPYVPEAIDMSDADFAPSVSVGGGVYNGSSVYDKHENIVNDFRELNGNMPCVNGNDYLEVTSNFPEEFTNVSDSFKQNLKTADKVPIPADHLPGQNTDKVTCLMNGHSLKIDNKIHDPNISTKHASQIQFSDFPSWSSANFNLECDKYPVQCNTPLTPRDNFSVNPLQSQTSEMNSKTHFVQNGLDATSVCSQNEKQDMQDITKLKLLKDSLELEVISRKSPESYINMTEHLSYSFPENLPKNMVQNALDVSSSLPVDMQNKKINNSITKQIPKEICNLASFEKLDNLVEKRFETNVYDQKQTLDMHDEQCSDRGIVVGFEDILQDLDKTAVEAYLLEGLMDSDPSVTNDSLLGEKNCIFQTGLVNFHDTSMTGEKNLAKLDINCGYARDSAIDVDSGVTDLKAGKIGFDVKSSLDSSCFTDSQVLSTSSKLQKDAVTSVQELNKNDSDMEIITIFPVTQGVNAFTGVPKSVIPDLDTNLSPSVDHSLDSGCASMSENTEDQSKPALVSFDKSTDVGTRPKDTRNKVNRPNSLIGLSTVDLESESPFLTRPLIASIDAQLQTSDIISVKHNMENMLTENLTESNGEQMKQNVECMVVENEALKAINSNHLMNVICGVTVPQQRMLEVLSTIDNELVNEDTVMRYPDRKILPANERPVSWSPADSGLQQVQKLKRPKSLNLPLPGAVDADRTRDDISSAVEQDPRIDANMEDNDSRTGEDTRMETVGACGGAEASHISSNLDVLGPAPPYSCTLGQVAPKWIPDADAISCMSCGGRFTFTKRRHHCRACGKVFCYNCCNLKNKLAYLKNQEARVCHACHNELALATRSTVSGPYLPHPNNPSDYCSVVPPSQAASSTSLPPSVLVPVLKRDGSSRRSEHKQVMFSDGIRPGGDLTELDGATEGSKIPVKKTRVQKCVERTGQGQHSARSRRLNTESNRIGKCFIPVEGLPPLLVPLLSGKGHSMQTNPNPEEFMPDVKDAEKLPVIFALNTNLQVLVKIATLDCCMNQTVWCFTTKGMTSVGQDEIVIVLECLPDEDMPPSDIFTHLHNIYEEAGKGNTVGEMGHSIFNQSFLGSRDHGGFLYIRATFQCVQNLILPNPPYLFGILLQKWETPWAKVFPLRLLLRLGAEYRYYPCPLVGIRNRKPVFFEIGHTIMNLLADLRNYQYMLPNIHGITIHMEDKMTKINFPRNRYQEVMKVVNNSNEHVMAIAATFCAEADSHLVCIQNDDGNYQTQAINIQNKTRKVTGASFVVFNGALKTSSGLSAKSSIVEDGLMVQINTDSMLALKQAIHDMVDYTINCGLSSASKPDETVVIKWIEDDKNVNIGVKSPVDGMNMAGIESLRIHYSTDYVGDKHVIRWTEIFFIQNEERGSPKLDPVDLSRLGETLAMAFCMALIHHLERLKETGIYQIGLRVSMGTENVGYEAGAKGSRLLDIYMNDLDNELIPVIHRATQPDTTIVLELLFEILDL